MKYVILLVLLSLFLSVHGLEKKQNEIKSKLKSILGSNSHHQKVMDHSHIQLDKHSVSKTTTKTDPIKLISRTSIDSAITGSIFKWFYGAGLGYEDATYDNPDCRDLAFCMINNAQWGSELMDAIPRNPYPLDVDDLKDDIKELLKRVFVDGKGQLHDALRVVLANNYQQIALLCKNGETIDSQCQMKTCYQLFGYPAIASPVGGAKKTTGLLSTCKQNSDCAPINLCKEAGGTPICEKRMMNTCQCLSILDKTYASLCPAFTAFSCTDQDPCSATDPIELLPNPDSVAADPAI